MSSTPIKMPTPFTKTTRRTAPEPTGIEKRWRDDWDKKRDEQVKTFMRYDNRMSCLNFAGTLRRAGNTYVSETAEGKQPDMITVYGSYKITDNDNPQAEAFTDKFLHRIGDDDTDYITKYLDERNIVILKKGFYTTGCMEFEDGSLAVINPLTGLMCSKPIKDLHSIQTFYAHLKMLTPTQFAEVKKMRSSL